MLYLTAETQIFLAIQSVDFRKQIDALIALCEQKLQQDPRSGCLFVFINRSRTMIRILCYESNGYWLATKRLSRGRYSRWPKKSGAIFSLSACELTKILKEFVASTPKFV
jgi:transposase